MYYTIIALLNYDPIWVATGKIHHYPFCIFNCKPSCDLRFSMHNLHQSIYLVLGLRCNIIVSGWYSHHLTFGDCLQINIYTLTLLKYRNLCDYIIVYSLGRPTFDSQKRNCINIGNFYCPSNYGWRSHWYNFEIQQNSEEPNSISSTNCSQGKAKPFLTLNGAQTSPKTGM